MRPQPLATRISQGKSFQIINPVSVNCFSFPLLSNTTTFSMYYVVSNLHTCVTK